MDLEAYFARIGFKGVARVDEETLITLHRQHLLNIPYEYIDVSLGRPTDISVEHAYSKIVQQGRGGWCYEMNGLFAWALAEVGFDVTRMAGAVMRTERGDEAYGNHLVLGVQLEHKWLVDVGFGDGLFEPVPLVAGKVVQRGFEFRIERTPDSWRIHNHPFCSEKNFDFVYEPADEHLLAKKCSWLSSDERSTFVKNIGCELVTPDGYDIQVGRVAKRVSPRGVEQWTIDSVDELISSIHARFGLEIPDLAGLWDKVCERHEVVMRENANGL